MNTTLPTPVNGPFAAKRRTEPAASIATVDKPMAESAVRDWVVKRTEMGGTLAGASLALADLSRLQIPGVQLATADLWAANFDQTNLAGANLSGADLRTTSFRGAVMTAVNVRGADLSGARFDEDTDLTGVLWDHATTWPVDFTPPSAALEVDLT